MKLRLDLLCTLLAAIDRARDEWPSPESIGAGSEVDYRTLLHHIAFAIGESLVASIGTDPHHLELTSRGRRVHALLCDPQRKGAMANVLGERTANELSPWLEEHVPGRPGVLRSID